MKFQHILHLINLADHPDPWSGPTGNYYLSDQKATTEYLSACGYLSLKAIDAFSKILGSTVVAKIHGRTFSICKDYAEEIKNERIIRRGKDWILSEHYSAVWQSMLRSKVIRESDEEFNSSYWVESIGLLPGYRERFYEISEFEFVEMSKEINFDEEGFPVVTPVPEEILAMTRRFWESRRGGREGSV